MKYLWDEWHLIEPKIRQAGGVFLFLDYDGTLVPIAPTPAEAVCPAEMRALLQGLRDLPNVYLAIISGRFLEDIREKVGVPGITYVGNHGLSIQNPAGLHKKRLSPIRREEFNMISQALRESLERIPGILFEDKGLTLAIHYRNVDREYFGGIQHTLEQTLKKWKEGWRIACGKMVYEVQPNIDFNKGKAVQEILRSYPSLGLLSIYLGDDRTDEDAFRALKGRGLTVFVGPGRPASEAEFSLENPSEVKAFLLRCAKVIREKISQK